MASAVLAARNETATTTWNHHHHHHQQPRTAGYMGKLPFLNPNPNPNPNVRKQFSHHHHQNNNSNNNGGGGDEFTTTRPTASDDASSFNHRRGGGQDADVIRAGAAFSHYVSFDISSYSRSELRSLKARLMSELDKVRSLSSRIESSSVNPNPKKRPMPFQQQKESKRFASSSSNGNAKYVASAQVMKMCSKLLMKMMKQKGGYIFNTPVDAVGLGLHDYFQVVKKPMDLGTIKKNLGDNLYPTPEDFSSDVRLTFNNALLYNPKGHDVHILAEQFLANFERQFQPIYLKFQSEKQQYLLQSRKQHQKPESRSEPRPNKDDSGPGPAVVVVDNEVHHQSSSWSKQPSPVPTPVPKKPEPAPPLPPRVEPTPPPPAPTPTPAPEVGSTPVVKGHVGRAPSGKLPKPKAKDPNKREMSMEEKHKLGVGLQDLPEEKMAQVIQIIRKRNGHLTQDGDEIELDIEAVDTETLWELDRFVTNYKKMVSKMKRQALNPLMGMGMAMPSSNNNNVGGHHHHHHHHHHDSFNQAGGSERLLEAGGGKVKKGGGDVGEEDVDIGDEMPVNNFPPLEIEKDDDRQQGGATSSSSSSSSSSSDDSSSSDSDSGSSSGSDSDVDDAQSRDNESKNIHH